MNQRLADIEDSSSSGPVSHDEARAIVSRYNNGHWHNPGDRPVYSIPANPRTDSDIRMCAYIHQCREREKMLRDVAAALGVADSLDIATCNVMLHVIEALKANQRFSDTLAEDRCKQCGKRCPNATCPACQELNVRAGDHEPPQGGD